MCSSRRAARALVFPYLRQRPCSRSARGRDATAVHPVLPPAAPLPSWPAQRASLVERENTIPPPAPGHAIFEVAGSRARGRGNGRSKGSTARLGTRRGCCPSGSAPARIETTDLNVQLRPTLRSRWYRRTGSAAREVSRWTWELLLEHRTDSPCEAGQGRVSSMPELASEGGQLGT